MIAIPVVLLCLFVLAALIVERGRLAMVTAALSLIIGVMLAHTPIGRALYAMISAVVGS
jgi:hypothetical protein